MKTRTRIVALAIALSALVGVTATGCDEDTSNGSGVPTTVAASTAKEQTRKLVNDERRDHGLRALPARADAERKAQSWANELARRGTMSHSNVTSGITDFCYVAENVGYAVDPDSLHDFWMNSAPHKANILDRRWTHMGVGTATGTVQGWKVNFTVTVFVQDC
jgi:uncharacterized protein YkwD